MRLGVSGLATGALSGTSLTDNFYCSAGERASLRPAGPLAVDAEMTMAEDWARSFGWPSGTGSRSGPLLPEIVKPPFSFIYGDSFSGDLLPTWKSETNAFDWDGSKRVTEVSYRDHHTGLLVRAQVVRFRGFSAVEWVLHFKNTGRTKTPILRDVQALDAVLRTPQGDPVIHYARGATCSINDFMPLSRVLGPRGTLELQPGGGRSSSLFLPFFNLESNGEGAVLAIGWSGEWSTFFHHPNESPEFRARAGMALTHLALQPGEEIRTPRILMLFWQGKPERGQNLLRRFLLAHHRPQVGGKPVQVPITNHNWGGTPASDHLENVRQIAAHDLPVEYYWIDAEWFGKGQWWKSPGNWAVKKDLYPEGFKPISDLLHASGRKLLLWFEPERVCQGTPWYTEHREWLLEVPKGKKVYRGFDGKGDWDVPMSDPRWVPDESARNQIQENDMLFNLALPEAREFLTNFISARIDEFGLDCFRNDANIAPLEFWRAADAPDRQGITEIRWIEGFYAFWDELRRRHPDLIIDDCASGGRRIDLETIGRSTALSRTDFVGDMLANQCHSFGLLRWVPMNTTSAGTLGTDNEYKIRSSMTTGLSFGLFASGDRPQAPTHYSAFPFAEVKRSIDRYRAIQRFFYGDFYPLTEYTQANDAWMAYQLDLPESGEGLVVVLKRPMSEYVRAIFALHELKAGSGYEVTNLDSGEQSVVKGTELMNTGIEVKLPNRPDSTLISYRRRD